METKRDGRYKTVGFVRMQKNTKTGEFFLPVSFEDGTRGSLRLDKAKMQAVKQDESQLGKLVVGTISVDTQAPVRKASSSYASKANGRVAAKASTDTSDGLPF